ncbi:MAG: putative rane protein [Actinomycetota bacterium]|nr:putative rane protein [Actinomycetota bacterium]
MAEDAPGDAVGYAKDRFPQSVFAGGDEPDPRFSLANERTFLAWIRTSLALLAGGVAVAALHLSIPLPFRAAASLILVFLGAGAATNAWLSWANTERSLRRGRALKGPTFGLALTVGILLVIIVLLIGSLL